ncbi:MAG: RDD family protein [Micrococcales bacterium]|nr:RDD family protein [Micrococcales bacterium]
MTTTLGPRRARRRAATLTGLPARGAPRGGRAAGRNAGEGAALGTVRSQTDGPVLVRPAEVPPVAPRLAALAVDQLLVVTCCLVTTALWSALGGSGRGLIVAWLVIGLLVETGQAFAEAVSGATLGGALSRVRTVSARTGWPAGLVAVGLRRLVLTAAGVLLPVVGAYVVAGSGEWNRGPTRRGWHDWAADTLVLRDWAVPDQDGRAAERARRQAARTAEAAALAAGPSAPAGPVPEHPRARHRATTLGRPRPYTTSGRHRVPEVPTQRTAPRARADWPWFVDDVAAQ